MLKLQTVMRRIPLFIFLSILTIVVSTSHVAFAQNDDLLTLTAEGTSKATSAVEAAREIQIETIGNTARTQVIDIMGEKRYLKNKAAVESKIIKQSAKYIPYVNPGTPVQQSDGTWKMPVELRLSQASLRRMILEAGLLNDADGPASIVPLVTFNDRQKGVALRWWQGEPKDEAHKFLAQLSRSFYDRFQTEFSRQGFHLMKPLETQNSPLPEPYRVDRLSNSDMVFISDYFNAPMVLKGDIRFKESKESSGVVLIAIKLQVLQPVSGRTVAEVTRQVETEPGAFDNMVRSKLATEFPELSKDLATQVLEAWQRGTLNTNLIRLSVRGRLTPKQLNEFKTGLVQNVHEVKSIKERAFESGQVLFEVDYTGEPGPLAEHLRSMKLAPFETRLAEASEKGLALEVRAH
jgi:hypothetical protein